MRNVIAISFISLCFSVLAANITHHATADFFSYVKEGPIGSDWSASIPSEHIPGGVAPEDAKTRLSDEETRLAFIGTFDAYLRRFLAGHAFGTAETKEYKAYHSWSAKYPYIIESPKDWIADKTTIPLFHDKLGSCDEGWATSTNRVYAVTNITTTITNWVGWSTNVVTAPNGTVSISISNLYEVESVVIPNTARILDRYKASHAYVRGTDSSPLLPTNPNGLKYLGTLRQGDYGTPAESPYYGEYAFVWPARCRIVTKNTDHAWDEGTNIGWSWSEIGNLYRNPFAIENSDEDWSARLSSCLPKEEWGRKFPTTWDICGAPNSRSAITALFWQLTGDEANPHDGEGLLGYQDFKPADWEKVLSYICSTSITATTGINMITNLIGASFSETETDRIWPFNDPSRRIIWSEWAGTDAFLAHTDTALIGPSAMPRLQYNVFETNVYVEVGYTIPQNEPSLLFVEGHGVYNFGTPSWVFSVTSKVCNVDRSSTRIGVGSGYKDRSYTRQERALINPEEISAKAEFYPGRIDIQPSEWEDGLGVNCIPLSRTHVNSMLSRLAAKYESAGYLPIQAGDIVHFNYVWSEDGFIPDLGLSIGRVWGRVLADRIDDFHSTAPWVSTVVDEFDGSLQIMITSLDVFARCDLNVITTADLSLPYTYNLNSNIQSSSIPCCYPNPSYAGNDKIENVAEIIATSLSTIAFSTNRYDVEYGHSYTDGFLFNFGSESGLVALDVDNFFSSEDLSLNAKLKSIVKNEAGFMPTTNTNLLASHLISQADANTKGDSGALLTEMIGKCLQDPHSGYSSYLLHTFCDPCCVRVLSITPTDAHGVVGQESRWYNVEYQPLHQAQVTNATGQVHLEWQPTTNDLRRCWSGELTMTFSNELFKACSIGANGRLRGMEAVTWDFDTMKKEDQAQ